MPDSLLNQFAAIEPIDWIAMLAGIIGVSLSIKERLSAWPFFILCYLAYVYISLRSGYYAFAAMNITFVGIAVYGWHKWSAPAKSPKEDNTHSLQVSRLPRQLWPLILLLIAAGTLVFGWMLSQVNAARLPFLDAFAVSNALVAQWMLSRKHIENWLFWIVSDIVYINLFFNDRLWPSVILFSAFVLLACKGWHDWKKNSEE